MKLEERVDELARLRSDINTLGVIILPRHQIIKYLEVLNIEIAELTERRNQL